MTPDTHDTIAAIATPRAAGPRGVVRLSGPETFSVLKKLGFKQPRPQHARRYGAARLVVEIDRSARELSIDILLWPDERSYTRQPAAELHTVGSPPVLDALLNACFAAGARLAEPGEYTLRAFLAGRLDLTQAEAVLSVIDAADADSLRPALARLAGGLSTPLHRLRADLLGLLADLEAGLDFVEEEDVRFVESTEVTQRIKAAIDLVEATRTQLSDRDNADRLPTVALVGPPNVGKSSLFNALVDRFGDRDCQRALVADTPGVTRDTVESTLTCDDCRFRLVDTAGADQSTPIDEIDAAARRHSLSTWDAADLRVVCQRAPTVTSPGPIDPCEIGVATQADICGRLAHQGWIATSVVTGERLEDLARAVIDRLSTIDTSDAEGLGPSQRVITGLQTAGQSLARASEAADAQAGDELVALELRTALDGLGRVVGQVVTDEILGEIFGRFCIGK